MAADGVAVPPLRVYVSTDLPVGAGMSSGVALEVATLRALRNLLDIELDDVRLAHRLLPMPPGSELIVIDSGMPRALAASACDVRRTEYEEASRLLGKAALRDLTDLALVETLPTPYRERARHVVREASAGVSAAR